MTNTINLDRLLVEKISKTSKYKDRKGVIRIFGAFLVLISALLIAFTAEKTISQTREDAVKSLRSQVNILLQARADLMDVWLEGLGTSAARVTESDLFRLFAAEYIKQANQPPVPESEKTASDQTAAETVEAAPSPFTGDGIDAQVPYLNRVLTDFVGNSPYKSAVMADNDGKIILSSSPEITETSPVLKKLIQFAFDKKSVVFSPVRDERSSLIMDVIIPIFAPQSATGQTTSEQSPVTVFIFSTPVKEKLASFIMMKGDRNVPGQLRLFQETGDDFTEIRFSGASQVVASKFRLLLNSPAGISFSQRESTDTPELKVFSSAQPLKRNRWHITWEVPVDTALADVRVKERNIIVVSVLGILFTAAAFTAFWWYGRNRFNRRMANMYHNLARQIETQKWLLDSINSAVAEGIVLKDGSGKYMYANPAFAALVGKTPAELIEKTDADIFGEIAARRLDYWDRIVLETGEPVSGNEEFYLGTKKHYFKISKAPLKNDEIAEKAIVTIISDNTDLVEAQIAREKATEHTIMALSKTIEMRDPHLSGHSRKVAAVARMIAEAMNMSHQDITAVEMAGNLSQIGKIAIPRTILTKEARLNDQEITVMQKHIDHAITILQEVDFDIPVRETLYQMYERLDGQGYPRGLKGDDISVRARILGIADYFCARIEPRSYRSSISPEETIHILESMPDRYDTTVIAALKNVVRSPDFETMYRHLKS